MGKRQRKAAEKRKRTPVLPPYCSECDNNPNVVGWYCTGKCSNPKRKAS